MADPIKLFNHPTYKSNKPDWIRYRDCYEGNHETLVSDVYLWKHHIESKTDPNGTGQLLRNGRELRSRYLNIPEIIVSIWKSFFFRKAPRIPESTLKYLGDAINDIDGNGTSLHSFLKDDVLESLLVYGYVYILADAFNVRAANLAEEMAVGARPYLGVLPPLSVVDWQKSAEPATLNEYEALRYEYKLVEPRSDLTSKPKTQRYSKILSLNKAGQYEIQKYKAKETEPGKVNNATDWETDGTPIITTLKKIPVSSIESESWIHDVCEETLRHFNLRSSKDNILHQQGYTRAFLIGVDPENQNQIQAINEYVMPIIKKGGDIKWMPPTDVSGLDAAEKDAAITAFKQGLNLLRHVPADSGIAQSAETITAEKDERLAVIESTIDELETLINHALGNFAAFQNQELPENIELNRDISEQSLEEFAQVYDSFSHLFSKSEVIEKEVAKKAVSKLKLGKEGTKSALEALEEVSFSAATRPDPLARFRAATKES